MQLLVPVEILNRWDVERYFIVVENLSGYTEGPLLLTFMYETWLGFQSASLSHDTKRVLKTKLQIYTEPQPCFIHFVSCSLLLIPSCHISNYFSVIFPKSICSTKPNVVFFVSNYKNNSFVCFAFTINKSSKFFSVIGTKTLLSTNP